MANLYKIYNGAAPTTAALTKQATGTAIRTMLQIATPSGADILVVAWGIEFDGTAAATPIQCELFDSDVAASVMTAHSATNVVKVNKPSGTASQIQYGAALTGYAPGAAVTEGTPTTASRLLDYHQVPPTNQFGWEWSLGREPTVVNSRFLRVRVTAGASVNAICWVMWEE